MPDLHLPGDVIIEPPRWSNVSVRPPAPANVVVIPQAGPQGERGPAGDSSEALSFTHTQTVPVQLVQIHHNLPYEPAGVSCLASGDTVPLLGVSVTYPSTGIVELGFGVPFTGLIRLS